jgi:hypothetical protein
MRGGRRVVATSAGTLEAFRNIDGYHGSASSSAEASHRKDDGSDDSDDEDDAALMGGGAVAGKGQSFFEKHRWLESDRVPRGRQAAFNHAPGAATLNAGDGPFAMLRKSFEASLPVVQVRPLAWRAYHCPSSTHIHIYRVTGPRLGASGRCGLSAAAPSVAGRCLRGKLSEKAKSMHLINYLERYLS